MSTILRTLTVGCIAVVVAVGPSRAAEPVDTHGPLTIEAQGSFFIGGTVVPAEGLSGMTSGPDVTRAGTITTGKMYVQYQVPVAPRHLRLVM